ncbi:MAG: hypothetical protein P9L97_04845 [Candidatus Tenebribacter davisii]|nr:hypothetical protein [Candidatus Tenebribacter davisii]
MIDKQKKLKAAIMGVLYYLKQQEEESAKPVNGWARAGREEIMRNSLIVQFRGLRR